MKYKIIFVLIFFIPIALATPHVALVNDENFVFMENDKGEFTPSFSQRTEIASPHEVGSADFDKDGIKDVVVSHWQDGKFTIFWGTGENGQNRFTTQIYDLLAPGDHQMHASGIEDFNEDGLIDIALVDNSNTGPQGVYIILNNGNRKFSLYKFYEFRTGQTWVNIRYIHVGNLNNDEHVDLVVSNVGSNSIFLMLGDGQGNFEVRELGFPNMGGFNVVESGDVDSDGDSELIIANQNNIAILKNDNGEFREFLNFGSRIWQAAELVDVTNDNIEDIVAIAGNGFFVYKGNGQEVQCNTNTRSWFCPYYFTRWNFNNVLDMEVADFNGDGSVDIVVGNHNVDSGIGVFITNIQNIPNLGANCLTTPNCFISSYFRASRIAGGTQTMLSIYEDEEIVVENKFIRGDTDSDGRVTLTDAILILSHLFRGTQAPACLDAADSDDNGRLDLTDAVKILNHLFQGGPAFPAPYPERGSDPTPDSLICR